MLIAPFHTFVVVCGGFWASFSQLYRLRGDDGFIGKVEVSNENNSGDGSIKCLAQISCARRYLFWKVACTHVVVGVESLNDQRISQTNTLVSSSAFLAF